MKQKKEMNKKMSFLKRKITKFGQKIKEMKDPVVIFGNSVLAEGFIEHFAELGLIDRVSVISEDEALWFEDYDENLANIGKEETEDGKEEE